MRIQFTKIVAILLLAGSGDARPKNNGNQMTGEEWKPIAPTPGPQPLQSNSRSEKAEGQGDSKDIQSMNQSLRTVATQLLNASNSDHLVVRVEDTNTIKNDTIPEEETNPATDNSNLVGRPINSKFGNYFEISHPGEAMALTEEELEKEFTSTRLMTAHKNRPTTTGGISTWILLNPPSTTMKSFEEELDLNNNKTVTVIPESDPTTMIPTKQTSTTVSPTKVKTHQQTKVTVSSNTGTTIKPIKSTNGTKNVDKKIVVPPPTTVTKKIQTIRTTSNKPKNATLKTTVISTSTMPPTTVQLITKQKLTSSSVPPTRKVTSVNNFRRNATSSSKVEKVTFRPVQIISSTKKQSVNTEKPMFVTKIKASVLTENGKTGAPVSTTLKSNMNGTDLIEVIPVTMKSKTTTVQKNQSKIKIGIVQATTPKNNITVSSTIGKIDNKNTSIIEEVEGAIVDLKFDFNPELTKINQVEETGTTSTTKSSSTTSKKSSGKRRRQNTKRKKNKGRRRKPSTTTTEISSTRFIEITSTMKPLDEDVQESKIDPIESKIAAPINNNTKIKKKIHPVKPISTQIYNFLSREVMPSVGMMSLVGLGLGLASYFFYPFGGTINRRNYEVEPNYKYNMEEYGGNYGQSEEEVLSKILQGGSSDEKQKEIQENNYYRYQHYDGAYDTGVQTTRRYSGGAVYKPAENTMSPLKYRNNELGYDKVKATTVTNYRNVEQKLGSEFVVSTDTGLTGDAVANRQFVVGNVPKELNTANVVKKPGQNNFNYLANGGNYGESQTPRNEEEGYEEIEITPTAVAVEHGPRALRIKRDSVIQVIPSRREIVTEGKEEDLSNEILDIIDSAIPNTKDKDKENQINGLDMDKKKEQKEIQRKKLLTTLKTNDNVIETTTNTEDITVTPLVSTTIEIKGETTATMEDQRNTEEVSTTTINWFDELDTTTTKTSTKDPVENFNIFNFVKRVAEIKLRLGVTLLKHASEGFTRYLGQIQKRLNGEK